MQTSVGSMATLTLAWSSSLALLLFGSESGSGRLEALTWAILVKTVPAAFKVALMVRVAVLPAFKLPTFQMPVALVYVPVAVVALTNV